MLRLLQWLIIGHVHEWALPDKEGNIVDYSGERIAYYRHCRCTKCGKWRKFRT